VEQDETEDHRERGRRHVAGNGGSDDGAERGGHFEEHADADIGVALADVGGGSAGGSGDYGDEARADGVAEVDSEQEGERRGEDDAAAEAGERSEESGG